MLVQVQGEIQFFPASFPINDKLPTFDRALVDRLDAKDSARVWDAMHRTPDVQIFFRLVREEDRSVALKRFIVE
jgi:hypothetical protein